MGPTLAFISGGTSLPAAQHTQSTDTSRGKDSTFTCWQPEVMGVALGTSWLLLECSERVRITVLNVYTESIHSVWASGRLSVLGVLSAVSIPCVALFHKYWIFYSIF